MSANRKLSFGGQLGASPDGNFARPPEMSLPRPAAEKGARREAVLEYHKEVDRGNS